MGVGQLSESDAVDAPGCPFIVRAIPQGHMRNQFDLGNPDLILPPPSAGRICSITTKLVQEVHRLLRSFRGFPTSLSHCPRRPRRLLPLLRLAKWPANVRKIARHAVSADPLPHRRIRVQMGSCRLLFGHGALHAGPPSSPWQPSARGRPFTALAVRRLSSITRFWWWPHRSMTRASRVATSVKPILSGHPDSGILLLFDGLEDRLITAQFRCDFQELF